MPRDTERERFIDAAIDVGQLDLEVVDRRRHASRPEGVASPRASVG
jgi:hypothetical protein